MSDLLEILTRGALIGAGGAALMDAWAWLSRHAFNIRGLDFHQRIASAEPIRGERILGGVAHYSIGVAFALPLLAAWGLDWARSPTVWPPLVIGLVTILAPWFVMQPARGRNRGVENA